MSRDYYSTEISGCNCGKTTRLITRLAIDFIKDKGDCSQYMIIVKNSTELDDIRRKTYNVLENLTGLPRRQIMKKVRGHIFDNNHIFSRGWADQRMYFDEFDRYQWTPEGVHQLRLNTHWVRSLHACSSPSWLRKPKEIRPDHDPILSFIKISGGEYSHWYNEELDTEGFPNPEFVFMKKYGLFILPDELESLD